MAKIGILLSGCGVMDGSEIHESVLTLLAIDKNGHEAICFAPDKDQTSVINHLTNKPTNEKRNMLIEAARIARGNIKNIKDVSIDEIDAVILPGGFGAACNLSNFALAGSNTVVLPEVEKFLIEINKQNKPIGAICIAPNIIAKLFGKAGVKLTIGTDKNTAKMLEEMGAKHIDKDVSEILIDEKNKIVSTPAYMLAKSPKELETGINNLVSEVCKLISKSKIPI